ncbi:recombinase RecT [Allochromatium vinosum]|uniref:Phage recombination protein Bet n=1 Tax=Allochromatium vinosum (strain ATCC 17899 / DSM 180 / NBRC 103801 / NCIMB 10441 / D) TaxID=572477 RepID=D3RWF4_ALLVD|nr:recombinase RecT [Allochromatium vinosum]ADC64166.1 phage recombination protein Bet [Allochromatium vinosum DSM 180]
MAQSMQPSSPDLRLQVPETTLSALGLDTTTWQVLTESIFPNANTAQGILLAVRYCQARGLDVLKRPVNIVPMWSKRLGREVETIWPGINEVQITAARTGQYAGLDPAQFGPDQNRTFQGRVKTNGNWQDAQVEVTFPEWCEVTVYRLLHGMRCPFSERVYWLETYSRSGGAYSEVPTAMWIKRPRGQLLKCAKAASLRAAFPEEADYTAEEMAGKSLEPEEILVDTPSVSTDNTPVDPPETPDWMAQIDALIERAANSQAWNAAQDYFHQRFSGEALSYALQGLERAQEQALSPTAEAA